MIGRTNEEHMRREPVDLKQQRRNNPFDLACLVGVRALLSNRVELVEKQDTPASTGEFEGTVKPGGGLAEETRHDPFVANHVERKHQLRRDCFGDTGLTIARRSGQQQPVARFNPIAAQQLGPLLLLNQLRHNTLRDRGELQIVQSTVWSASTRSSRRSARAISASFKPSNAAFALILSPVLSTLSRRADNKLLQAAAPRRRKHERSRR